MSDTALQQSVLNKGRLDKFLLVLNLPNNLKNVIARTVRNNQSVNFDAIQYSIYGSPVPNIAVPFVDMPFAGQVAKVSSHARPSYTPMTVNFTVDNRFNNWWILWKWLDVMNNWQRSVYQDPEKLQIESRKIVGTLHDYATIVSIYGRDEFNKNIIEFKYYDTFITDLSEINYNYRVPDEISATFTFAYGQFEAILIDV